MMKNYTEDEYLSLSGIQHFTYCRRRFALIYIEQQWVENYLTADGRFMHDRAHNDKITEKRGDTITVRAVKIASHSLGFSGECDVVEFHADKNGVPLAKRDGLWLPYPVEYKRGNGISEEADSMQLCAQAICLEEMLGCEIENGALFYGENRRRTAIEFSDELRNTVKKAADEMHELFNREYTPKVTPGKKCGRCSLKELCLPELNKKESPLEYLNERLAE
jgi:CRISPR-associated exonuclease Cas4